MLLLAMAEEASIQAELEKSRESAARLLDTLAQKIGAAPALRGAATGMHRAACYVHTHTVRELIAGMERKVRRRPAYSIGIAVVAGFVVGKLLKPR